MSPIMSFGHIVGKPLPGTSGSSAAERCRQALPTSPGPTNARLRGYVFHCHRLR